SCNLTYISKPSYQADGTAVLAAALQEVLRAISWAGIRMAWRMESLRESSTGSAAVFPGESARAPTRVNPAWTFPRFGSTPSKEARCRSRLAAWEHSCVEEVPRPSSLA